MVDVSKNPTSDEAVSGTWTGTAGSRWQVVDDYPDTTGADFITAGTAASAITFGFTAFSIPAGSTGITVFVDYYDLKNGSQASAIAGRLKCGASYFNSSTHNPSNGSWVQRTDTFANNPATSAAWTVDQINGIGANALAAFGVNVSDASPTVSLSSIRIRVQYTPPAQNFDGGTPPVLTATAVAPSFTPGNTDFDVAAPAGTFSVPTALFFNAADFDVAAPSGSFVALDVIFNVDAPPQLFDVAASVATFVAPDPTFVSIPPQLFDVAASVATFAAPDPSFVSIPPQQFDVAAPVATFTALAVTFAGVFPQDFDVAAPTLAASALDVTFAGPSPTPPASSRRRFGGGGGTWVDRRRRRAEREERMLEALERLEAKLEEPPGERKSRKQKQLLTAAAGFLLTILSRRMKGE